MNSWKKFHSVFKKILHNVYLWFSHLFVINYAKVYVVLLCFLLFSAGADRQPLVVFTQSYLSSLLNIYLWFFTWTPHISIDIEGHTQTFVAHILIEVFETTIKKWVKRMVACLAANGWYFEKKMPNVWPWKVRVMWVNKFLFSFISLEGCNCSHKTSCNLNTCALSEFR